MEKSEITNTNKSNKLTPFYWILFIIFGGWNGVQVALQPQDLMVFVNENEFLSNIFLISIGFKENLPLIFFVVATFIILWQIISTKLDISLIQSFGTVSFSKPLSKLEKNNLTISLTMLSIIIWGLCYILIKILAMMTNYSLVNILDSYNYESSIFETLYIILISASSAMIIFLRHNLIIHYVNDNITDTYKKFKKHVKGNFSVFLKNYLMILLSIILSSLIYKWLMVSMYYKLKIAFFSDVNLNLTWLITRSDVMKNIPIFFFSLVISSILFAPLLLFIYKKLLGLGIKTLIDIKVDNVNKFVDEEIKDDLLS